MRSLLPATYCQQPRSCSKPTHSAPQYFAILSLFFHLDVKQIILKASYEVNKNDSSSHTPGETETERRESLCPGSHWFVLPCNVAVMGLGPSTGCWTHALEEKNFKWWFHCILGKRIRTVLEPGRLASSFRAHLNLSKEKKYQFCTSDQVLKELSPYSIELSEWASKGPPMGKKRTSQEKENYPAGWLQCDSCLPWKQVCPRNFLNIHWGKWD